MKKSDILEGDAGKCQLSDCLGRQHYNSFNSYIFRRPMKAWMDGTLERDSLGFQGINDFWGL